MFGQTSYTLIVYAPKIIFWGQRKFPIYIASQNDMVPYRAPKDKISQFSTGFVFCYLSSTTLHCQMAAQKTIIPLFHMYSSSNTSFAQTIFFNNKQFFTVIFFHQYIATTTAGCRFGCMRCNDQCAHWMSETLCLWAQVHWTLSE